MRSTETLLRRLDEIARSLAANPAALALLGLGSVGRELDRIDQYSDLDFFVLVEPGCKSLFLDDLGWLESVNPLAFSFRNTVDGYKIMFADGIFCEMAVFELWELPGIPFAPGRVVWKRDWVDETVAEPQRIDTPASHQDPQWLLGEAVTNLYVGLCRYRRGEKLSAMRFIQGYAVDRVLELVGLATQPASGAPDPYVPERRFEQRYPQTAERLSSFMQGYENSPQSAEAILAFLQTQFTINPAMTRAILNLCDDENEHLPAMSE